MTEKDKHKLYANLPSDQHEEDKSPSNLGEYARSRMDEREKNFRYLDGTIGLREEDKHKLYADNEPMENFTRVFNLDVPSKLPESMKWVDESFFKEQEMNAHQQQIRALNNKIEKLRKRLDDTEKFCDSLRDALKEYEQ